MSIWPRRVGGNVQTTARVVRFLEQRTAHEVVERGRQLDGRLVNEGGAGLGGDGAHLEQLKHPGIGAHEELGAGSVEKGRDDLRRDTHRRRKRRDVRADTTRKALAALVVGP